MFVGADALEVGGGPGRGAWLCAERPACFDLAVRRKALERALRRPLEETATLALRRHLYPES